MTEALCIRQAVPTDTHELASLMTEVAVWREAKGDSAEWPNPCTEEVASTLIAKNQPKTYLGILSDAAVASVATAWNDTGFWPEENNDAAYIYRLAVSPRYQGQSYGRALIDYVARQAQQDSRHFVRLDCSAENKGLRRYYERLGFVLCGFAEHQAYRGAKYQLKIPE